MNEKASYSILLFPEIYGNSSLHLPVMSPIKAYDLYNSIEELFYLFV